MRGVTECQTSGHETAKTNSIDIVVNGEPRSVPSGLSVSGLLAFLELDKSRVAVEMNRTIVRQRDWDATPVFGGAALEIVQFVGGG
jgi:sulfur carrier protein